MVVTVQYVDLILLSFMGTNLKAKFMFIILELYLKLMRSMMSIQ